MILRLENFLNPKHADELENFLTSDNFSWFYQDGVSTKNDNKGKYFLIIIFIKKEELLVIIGVLVKNQ